MRTYGKLITKQNKNIMYTCSYIFLPSLWKLKEISCIISKQSMEPFGKIEIQYRTGQKDEIQVADLVLSCSLKANPAYSLVIK
jgi:hypothetical protein